MLGDSIKRRRGKVRTPKPGRPDRPGKRRGPAFSWGRWIGAALVILVGSFLVGFLLSTQVLFPRPETAGTGVPVPDLYGETQEQAEATLLALGLVVGEVREMKSMTTQAGRVLAQSPLPGQQLLPGAVVDLGVSDGPPELRVPPLVGLGEGTARELLESVGFDVEVQQTRSMEMPAGVVTRAEPTPGTPRTLPATVRLVISSGPPPDSMPDSTVLGGLR